MQMNQNTEVIDTFLMKDAGFSVSDFGFDDALTLSRECRRPITPNVMVVGLCKKKARKVMVMVSKKSAC